MALLINQFSPKNKQKIVFFLLDLLFLAFFLLILNNFRTALSSISSTFGYMDYHHHWRVLDDFASLKMPFKDYFHRPSYGFFYLLIQFFPYQFFNRTFFALLIVRHLYLPMIAVIMSYFVARNVLRKLPLIIIFLFFCFLFRLNYIYESPRHLIAELSLSFFILYFLKNRNQYLLISGIIAGLSVLTSLEYGVALNLAIFLLFLFSFFSEVKLTKPFFNRFILGEIVVLAPYFFWLFINGVLYQFWEYSITGITNFYYASPCSHSSFPRLAEIKDLVASSQWLVFNIPIEFLQRFNFYLVFTFYIFSALILLAFFLKNKKISRNQLVKLALIIYGSLIYLRTLDTPCTGYFTYGLVPFFLLIALLIGDAIRGWQKKSLALKTVVILAMTLIFSWFVLTEDTGLLLKNFGKKETPKEKETFASEFYFPLGWFIRKDLAGQYQEITNYIVDNSDKNDFLYVYPWGPYNHLTGRRSPSRYPLPSISDREKIVEELQTKKPKFIVVNLYNNLGIAHYGKTRGDVGRYYSLESEDGPVFAGSGDAIQKYIIENYQVAFKNDLAVVMESRTVPITLGEKRRETATLENWTEEEIELVAMKKSDSLGKYLIAGEKASWILDLAEPIQASDLTVDLKLDGNLFTKHLTRYFLNLYVQTSATEEPILTRSVAHKNWQTVEINLGVTKEIREIKIEVGENTGLIWWLNPHFLEIKNIIFYLPNN